MASPTPSIVRLGTRGSQLALAQSRLVADELEKANPGVQVELIIIKTTGDSVADRPLHDMGGKGLFVKELELALLNREVDFAVHSFKDVPVTMPLVDESELVVAAVPKREDARDVLITRPETAGTSLATLAHGACIATGSLRRRCQILQRRPDLRVQPIRGNIDTRLRKLRDGDSKCDAMVLAMAGVRRAAMWDGDAMHVLEIEEMLPAAGQGALALQCRRDADQVRQYLAKLHDPDTGRCVDVERQVVALLGGDCHSPIAAYAEVAGQTLQLHTAVGARDGVPPVIYAQADGSLDDMEIAKRCGDMLLKKGAKTLLQHGNISA